MPLHTCEFTDSKILQHTKWCIFRFRRSPGVGGATAARNCRDGWLSFVAHLKYVRAAAIKSVLACSYIPDAWFACRSSFASQIDRARVRFGCQNEADALQTTHCVMFPEDAARCRWEMNSVGWKRNRGKIRKCAYFLIILSVENTCFKLIYCDACQCFGDMLNQLICLLIRVVSISHTFVKNYQNQTQSINLCFRILVYYT